MATPSFPAGFKPTAQGYNIGSPDGVSMTDVGGGLPRVAMQWDRGRQAFQVTMILPQVRFSIWSTWFHHIIKNGAIQFTMPIDTGFGLQSALCVMVPGSYSAVPVASARVWSVTFTVLAESHAYTMTDEDAAAVLVLWDAYGDDLSALLERLEVFATFDTLVLQA